MPTLTADRTDQRTHTTNATTPAECEFNVVDDFVGYVSDYAREHPDKAAMWCFGIGFLVGWKLKPW